MSFCSPPCRWIFIPLHDTRQDPFYFVSVMTWSHLRVTEMDQRSMTWQSVSRLWESSTVKCILRYLCYLRGWSDVFDPGNRILDRFVNISYSWLNRNICTYSHWDNHFYILGSGRKDLLPIPQCTEDNTLNVNVMCCPWCVAFHTWSHRWLRGHGHVSLE